MKKTLIVAAVAASFATAASAQSSVTLYGLVDAGFTYVNNVYAGDNADHYKDSQWNMRGGNVNMSRWGLRGAEDLGGGMKAIFTLESGFDVANGGSLGGSGFGRQAYVGLSTNAGTVTLGHQTDSVTDYLGPISATGSWGGTFFAHPGNLDNLNGDLFRENNSIKFQSANYAGLTFSGLYAFSNAAGSFAANRAYSLGAGYANAGLKLGAAYMQANLHNNGGNYGSAITGVTVDVPNFDRSEIAYAGIDRQRTFGAGGSYSIGAVTFGALWTQTRQDSYYSNVGSNIINNYEVNGRYALTPALSLGAAYTFTNAKMTDLGTGDSTRVRFHQFGLQTDYALSKRTDIYAEGVMQIASGLPEGVMPNAGISGVPTSSSNRQVLVTTGIRHRF
ncbi:MULTISPECIES: porin [unclassified Caballeronia]|uniref:porin n=1 Tax=unclassified Caballeronia TaxID=2646786 RepID=UPI00285B2E85|nr:MULTISPECIES: porin [unclassified Caballeronia]MDR5736762.1 porin [Caballeronia sp. LZ016]MDR5810757.1 porin [Caballeronia sp. LZ019]